MVVHALTDHRRVLPIEKTGELLDAHPDFLLVISYNPGYQSILKDLKPSTRQRFVSLEFDYPAVDVEADDHRPRRRRRLRPGPAPRARRGEGPQPQRVRVRGGRQHAAADLRRPAHRRRHRAAPRVRRRHRAGGDRRSRGPGGGGRHRRRTAAVTGGAAPDGEGGGVRLAEVQRVLALFAHGVAGRSLHLQPQESGPDLTRESVIGTDGGALRVPAEITAFASTRHNLGAYLVAVLHQVGQLLLGTFAFAEEHEMGQWPTRALPRFVFVKLEDRRIDAAIRRGYPGAAGDLDRFLARARAVRPSPSSLPLRDALAEALVQHSLGATGIGPLPGDTTGLLDRMLHLAGAVDADGATVHDSARATAAICALFDELGHHAPADPIDLEEAGNSSGPASNRLPSESGGALVRGGARRAGPAGRRPRRRRHGAAGHLHRHRHPERHRPGAGGHPSRPRDRVRRPRRRPARQRRGGPLDGTVARPHRAPVSVRVRSELPVRRVGLPPPGLPEGLVPALRAPAPG